MTLRVRVGYSVGMKKAFVAALVLSSACMRTSFVRTEPAFSRPARGAPPPVFLDRLPPRPYHSVGIIQVTSPAGSDLSRVIDAAADEGKTNGCDLVVDRAIHKVGSLDAPLVHADYQAQAAPPPSQREFICGIYDDGKTAAL